MKKAMVLMMVLVLALAGVAMAKVNGKVTAVNGDVVTIEVEKGKGGELAVGAAVEVDVKKEEKAAPKKGGDMLQGC
jgi:Skp family chaperone for outer membrane proteins